MKQPSERNNPILDADECRHRAQVECDYFNQDAEQQAIEEFEKGETAQYFQENARYVVSAQKSIVFTRGADFRATGRRHAAAACL